MLFKASLLLAFSYLFIPIASQTIGNECLDTTFYTLCQDSYSTIGYQNSTFFPGTSFGNTVSWSTNYTWRNADERVKAGYSRMESYYTGIQLGEVVAAPTSWVWNYTLVTFPVRASVGYSIWAGRSSTTASLADSAHEIRVWLSGRGNIIPQGKQAVSQIIIGGYTWNLWIGSINARNILTFMQLGELTQFRGDLQPFIKYLYDNFWLESTLYMYGISAGTEVYIGASTVYTTAYNVSIAIP